MQGKHGHLSREQKQLALRLHAKGWRLVDIAKEIGCSAPMVGIMARTGRHLDAKPYGWQPRQGCLTIDEREQILLGINRGDTFTAIAEQLGRAVSTVSREVKRGGGRCGYSAWHAHQRAREQARRPKPFKLASGRLLEEVTSRLEQLWSPEEIAARLRLDHANHPEMRVSHETIYQSLFVQGRGELRRELARCLRSGRAARKARGTTDGRGRIPGMVMISERPAEADDRAVPGHWEGDLILGEGSRSAVGTLVERSTRMTLLLHLPDGKSAEQARRDQQAAVLTGPDHHLGPRRGDVQARRVHHRHGHPDLLLRSPLALAARKQREHQRSAAPIPAQRHRPEHRQPRGVRRDPRQPQRTPTQDAGLSDTIREARRVPCAHRLNPPILKTASAFFAAAELDRKLK